MKQIATALTLSLLSATALSAMESKSHTTQPIVHSDPGEIRISPNNDSR